MFQFRLFSSFHSLFHSGSAFSFCSGSSCKNLGSGHCSTFDSGLSLVMIILIQSLDLVPAIFRFSGL